MEFKIDKNNVLTFHRPNFHTVSISHFGLVAGMKMPILEHSLSKYGKIEKTKFQVTILIVNEHKKSECIDYMNALIMAKRLTR